MVPWIEVVYGQLGIRPRLPGRRRNLPTLRAALSRRWRKKQRINVSKKKGHLQGLGITQTIAADAVCTFFQAEDTVFVFSSVLVLEQYAAAEKASADLTRL
jgi:hypothetical protein